MHIENNNQLLTTILLLFRWIMRIKPQIIEKQQVLIYIEKNGDSLHVTL